MGEEVSRAMRSIADAMSISGDVLVIFDSAYAYCVDHMQEAPRPELRNRSIGALGVGILFRVLVLGDPSCVSFPGS